MKYKSYDEIPRTFCSALVYMTFVDLTKAFDTVSRDGLWKIMAKSKNKFLTAKLLKQGYRYHKLRKAFSKFYRRHFELVEKYHVSLKKLMQQGICNPEFYGDLVYKFKKIIGNPNFSNLLKRIVNRFKRAGYSLDIMRQTASLVFNPIMVEGYAALFSCTAVVQASDSMTASM